MKNWWLSLSIHDRYFLGIGAVVIGILSIYLGLWMPLRASNHRLNVEVDANHRLLVYLQNSQHKLVSAHAITAPQKVMNLPKLVHDALQGLTEAKVIDKQQTNQVDVQLPRVSFDAFIQWLVDFKQHYAVSITELRVIKHKQSGIVSVDLQLVSAG